jgi:hypothetical protein
MNNDTHVIMTSDTEWDPKCLDHDVDFDGINPPQRSGAAMDPDDDYGETAYSRTVSTEAYHASVFHQDIINASTYEDIVDHMVDYYHSYVVNTHSVAVPERDFNVRRPNFGWAPADIIKRTFDCTTQWAKMVERYPFRKHFKSRFPALNVPRRNEPVATDTVFSDTPAIVNGCRIAQLFVGHKTLVTDVYPMKNGSDFIRTLLDNGNGELWINS